MKNLQANLMPRAILAQNSKRAALDKPLSLKSARLRGTVISTHQVELTIHRETCSHRQELHYSLCTVKRIYTFPPSSSVPMRQYAVPMQIPALMHYENHANYVDASRPPRFSLPSRSRQFRHLAGHPGDILLGDPLQLALFP